MKMTSPAAATALAALYSRDRLLVQRSFDHLTRDALQTLDQQLLREYDKLHSADDGLEFKQEQCNLILAHACIRRIAWRYLGKYAKLVSSTDVVEDALKHYTLPTELQEQLALKYGSDTTNKCPPTTWYDALEQLKTLATCTSSTATAAGVGVKESSTLDKGKLWRLILDHPITAYVPVQCQECGHVIPDQYPLQQTDKEVGLKEIPPTGDELELRSGWFRGPRKAVLFQLTCPNCQHISTWYRSGHPKIILNPNKWGRLCGEQEDLRLILADYLKIPVRLVCPLDWDHIWSEYQSPSLESSSTSTTWQVQDGSARNFCCRLDEGIGSWTRVWCIHPNPEWCQDVTQEYLAYKKDRGRADDQDDENNATMKRYEQMIATARKDASGNLTQAKTCNGHVLERAKLSDDDITYELQRATRECGTKEWWQI